MSKPTNSTQGSGTNRIEDQTVYGLIHELHTTITKSIDTSLSWEALNSPPVNYTLVRPIVEKLCPKAAESKLKSGDRLTVPLGNGEEAGLGNGQREGEGNGGMGLGMRLYALMANRYVSSFLTTGCDEVRADDRIQFITLAGGDLSYAPLQTSRAAFCELLACTSSSFLFPLSPSPPSSLILSPPSLLHLLLLTCPLDSYAVLGLEYQEVG
jgi:hypothetical protein